MPCSPPVATHFFTRNPVFFSARPYRLWKTPEGHERTRACASGSMARTPCATFPEAQGGGHGIDLKIL